MNPRTAFEVAPTKPERADLLEEERERNRLERLCARARERKMERERLLRGFGKSA